MLPRHSLRAGLLACAGIFGGACHMDSPHDTTPSPEIAAAQVRIGGVDWYVDYEAAVEIARAQDKALWVHFGENPG